MFVSYHSCMIGEYSDFLIFQDGKILGSLFVTQMIRSFALDTRRHCTIKESVAEVSS